MDLEQLGLFGVFLGGAIPWLEAITVVPTGILFGLNPFLVVLAAFTGNALTIFLFAFGGAKIRDWFVGRSFRKSAKSENPAKSEKAQAKSARKAERAQKAFDKYGIFGLAALGPIIIGTQFAAAIAVAAGIKPLKTSLIISLATLIWAAAIAVLMVLGGLDTVIERQLTS